MTTQQVFLSGGVLADFHIESTDNEEAVFITIWLPTPDANVDIENAVAQIFDQVVPGLKQRPQGLGSLHLKGVTTRWSAPSESLYRWEGLFQSRLYNRP